MKLLIFFSFIILFNSCRETKISDHLCSEWEYLKYPIVYKGFIGVDASPQGDICYQRKWMSYVGFSKNCIIELLGEPSRIEKNTFIYYFSSYPENGKGVVGVLYMYFQKGKMKRIHCSLA